MIFSTARVLEACPQPRRCHIQTCFIWWVLRDWTKWCITARCITPILFSCMHINKRNGMLLVSSRIDMRVGRQVWERNLTNSQCQVLTSQETVRYGIASDRVPSMWHFEPNFVKNHSIERSANHIVEFSEACRPHWSLTIPYSSKLQTTLAECSQTLNERLVQHSQINLCPYDESQTGM